MSADSTYEMIRRCPELPSPPGVVLRVLELARRDDCDARALTRVIESDPAIAARILRVTNSAMFGVAHRVGSLPQAVAYLGLRNVTWITLGFSLIGDHRQGRCARFDYDGFWSESLARATAARNLAWFLRSGDPNEAFVGGLLGQIGRLAFAQVYPERYDNLLATAGPTEAAELCELERALFELDHVELGARLIADWRLPREIADAVQRQYHPPPDLPARQAGGPAPDPGGNRLPYVLFLAGLTARVLVPHTTPAHLPRQLIRCAHHLGIAAEVVHHLFDRIAAEWQEAATIFTVPARSIPSLVEIMGQARELRDAIAATPPVRAALAPAPPG